MGALEFKQIKKTFLTHSVFGTSVPTLLQLKILAVSVAYKEITTDIVETINSRDWLFPGSRYKNWNAFSKEIIDVVSDF